MNEESTLFILSDHAKKRVKSRSIDEKWLSLVLSSPVRIDPDQIDNGLRHYIVKLSDSDTRILRVVGRITTRPYLIITAFFDRNLRGKL